MNIAIYIDTNKICFIVSKILYNIKCKFKTTDNSYMNDLNNLFINNVTHALIDDVNSSQLGEAQ